MKNTHNIEDHYIAIISILLANNQLKHLKKLSTINNTHTHRHSVHLTNEMANTAYEQPQLSIIRCKHSLFMSTNAFMRA